MITKTDVKRLLDTFEKRGYEVHYTLHGGDGLVWDVWIYGPNTMIEKCGGTHDVYTWLYGVLNGLWLLDK